MKRFATLSYRHTFGTLKITAVTGKLQTRYFAY